jgi:hypothetical protein
MVETKTIIRGAVRLKALRILYEHTEDGRLYGWSRLVELLARNGINEGYAKQILLDLYLLGILEKPKTGLYKVNRAKLGGFIAEFEASMAHRSKLGGGGSGGQAPGQERA